MDRNFKKVTRHDWITKQENLCHFSTICYLYNNIVASPTAKFIKHTYKEKQRQTIMNAFDISARSSCHNIALATTPFRHLSSSYHLMTLKLQHHVSIGERRSIRVVRITASLWPNTDSTVSQPSPAESNGALEIDSPYSFLKCDGSKTVHAGTIICLSFLYFSIQKNICDHVEFMQKVIMHVYNGFVW